MSKTQPDGKLKSTEAAVAWPWTTRLQTRIGIAANNTLNVSFLDADARRLTLPLWKKLAITGRITGRVMRYRTTHHDASLFSSLRFSSLITRLSYLEHVEWIINGIWTTWIFDFLTFEFDQISYYPFLEFRWFGIVNREEVETNGICFDFLWKILGN